MHKACDIPAKLCVSFQRHFFDPIQKDCPMTEIRMGKCSDASLFRSAGDVFDAPPDPALVATFLKDPRHHIVLALDPGIVGFVSAVHYIHPDKPVELWINEVSVHEKWRRRGICRKMMQAMFDHGASLGASAAWVIADDTPEAHGFYQSLNGQQTGSQLAMFTFTLGN